MTENTFNAGWDACLQAIQDMLAGVETGEHDLESVLDAIEYGVIWD